MKTLPEDLQKKAKEISKYLRENQNPYVTVEINGDGTKATEVTEFAPISEKGEIPALIQIGELLEDIHKGTEEYIKKSADYLYDMLVDSSNTVEELRDRMYDLNIRFRKDGSLELRGVRTSEPFKGFDAKIDDEVIHIVNEKVRAHIDNSHIDKGK
ncbi:hypothetical protein ACWEWU_10870 [Staphylococcus xylosus]